MKNKLTLILLASLPIFINASAVADPLDKNYVGIQYGIGRYTEKDISKDFYPTALVLRLGHYFQPNFSFEGRFAKGLNHDEQFLSEFGPSGLNARFKIDTIIGLYGTGHINLSKAASLYGILGFSSVEATASVPEFSAASSSETNTSISYGIGADIVVFRNSAINIEYMQYLIKSDFGLGIIGLGASTRF
jgi:hypothetical protein